MNEELNGSGSMVPQEPPAIDCAQMEDLCVLFVCDELAASDRAAVEAHAKSCTRCADVLAREQAIEQLLAHPVRRQEPSDILLAQCRSELAEALDDATQERSRPTWLEAFRPLRWLGQSFVGHPAWSAALLVLFGVALGVTSSYWSPGLSGSQAGAVKPVYTVSSRPRLSDQDLQRMSLDRISYGPDSGTGQPGVVLHVTTEKPFELVGSSDDTEVMRVLMFVVANGQRFDPGVRLDSLEVLRTRTEDSDVRKTLCAAARRDTNPGVRLRALEALTDAAIDDQVRQTLLDALTLDDNPGVRVEAITLLSKGVRAMSGQSGTPVDPQVLKVLRDRMERDPSNYVRMQSAAAIRDLGPRREY